MVHIIIKFMFYRSNYFACCDFSVPKTWKIGWKSMQPRRFMCFSAFPLSLVNFSNESRKPAGAKDLSPEKQCLSWATTDSCHFRSSTGWSQFNSLYIVYFLDKHMHIRMYCPWSAASMYTYLFIPSRTLQFRSSSFGESAQSIFRWPANDYNIPKLRKFLSTNKQESQPQGVCRAGRDAMSDTFAQLIPRNATGLIAVIAT